MYRSKAGKSFSCCWCCVFACTTKPRACRAIRWFHGSCLSSSPLLVLNLCAPSKLELLVVGSVPTLFSLYFRSLRNQDYHPAVIFLSVVATSSLSNCPFSQIIADIREGSNLSWQLNLGLFRLMDELCSYGSGVMVSPGTFISLIRYVMEKW